ncbi:MAG: Na+:solute symporter, partial [Flavobacteriaceae bacterium]|nr:Na+:solute symporter [Eudoraea sp.]NNJ38261.1 Na+:solute symporter [Flavobacteriaceae bacterium]
IWLAATYITQPESQEVLRGFYKKIQPGGPGWKKVIREAETDKVQIAKSDEKWSVPAGITAMLLGCVLIYTCMFATGFWIYGDYVQAGVLTGVAIISGYSLSRVWLKMKDNIL